MVFCRFLKVIADISQNANGMTEKSGIIIKDAVQKMQIIEKTTIKSKDIIYKLGERSSEKCSSCGQGSKP